MSTTRRELIAGVATVLVASRAKCAETRITPEQFGAKGDGRTNDTAAFAAMSAMVNRRGGGLIILRKRTYIVGKQTFPGREGFAFAPLSIMNFDRCSMPLIIQGNGARLRCADRLRFGTFDRGSHLATNHAQPFYETGELSSPYLAMINAENCTGPITISDVELDGNLRALRLGGPWGDTGWQIACCGIRLSNNQGPELLQRIRSHHHAQDGLLIDGLSNRRAASLVEAVNCDFNSRQGCSLVGGRNYRFVDCEFQNTGKAGLYSAPGAGVDIEAEAKTIRQISFERCLFSNNSGCGMVADQGDSEDAVFSHCRFIGTTNWSAWPNKARMRFVQCVFVGAVANPFASTDAALATVFEDCKFSDDARLSPSGRVFFNSASDSGPIVDLGGNGGTNVLFSGCFFDLTEKGRLPWSWNAIYANNTMRQASSETGYPRGHYVGRNTIEGKVDLYSSKISGELTVNGHRINP